MPWLENVSPEVWPTKVSITSFNVSLQLLLDVGCDDIIWLRRFDLLIISDMRWNLAGSPWESMTFAKEGPCRSLICSPICSLFSWYTKRRFLLMPSFFFIIVFSRGFVFCVTGCFHQVLLSARILVFVWQHIYTSIKKLVYVKPYYCTK